MQSSSSFWMAVPSVWSSALTSLACCGVGAGTVLTARAGTARRMKVRVEMVCLENCIVKEFECCLVE